MRTGRDAAARAARRMAAEITVLTRRAVEIDPGAVLDRSQDMALATAGRVSPNGSCRLVRATGGWIAVNLPREDDADLVPAWTGCAFSDPVWAAIESAALAEPAAAFVARGAELGLAVSLLGETAPEAGPRVSVLPGGSRKGGRRLRVLDLSALWAGPLCAGILAMAGHEVTKVESRTRPDPLARSAPAHDARLNGLKRRLAVAFTRETLLPLMLEADVIVTSARPRAFAALDLMPERLSALKPHLIWVAITAHGWDGTGAGRIGFGDDAAVAGGLVDWRDDEPAFAGDALADPLTGLAAAVAAREAIAGGDGAFIDAALARTAADATGH